MSKITGSREALCEIVGRGSEQFGQALELIHELERQMDPRPAKNH